MSVRSAVIGGALPKPKPKPKRPLGKPPKRAKSEIAIGREIGVSQSTARSWLQRTTDPMPADGPERQAWLERHGKTGGTGPRIPSEHGRSSNERLLAEAEQVAKLEKARKQNKLLDITIAVKEKQLVLYSLVVRSFSQHVTDARVLLETIPENIVLLVDRAFTCQHCGKANNMDCREPVRTEARRIVNDACRALAKGKKVVENIGA